MPKLYIIAGCNGAGKTTASYTVLPEMLDCREFVNADEIAKGLSPFNPESVAIDAGRPVSYTHLDVYKRQPPRPFRNPRSACRSAVQESAPEKATS